MGDDRTKLQEELSSLSVSSLFVLQDLLETERPWSPRKEYPDDFNACLEKLNALPDDDDARWLGISEIAAKKMVSAENPLQAAKKDVLDAKMSLSQANSALRMKIKLSSRYDNQLDTAFDLDDADAIRVAEEKVQKANADVKESTQQAEKCARDMDAARKAEEKVYSEREAILNKFRCLENQPTQLTKILPFGMLGRDQCVHDIKRHVKDPNDKIPPIMIIATSRSGKTLMLDTLKTTFNADPTSGIFVVTCSLNNHRATALKFEGKKCKTSDAPHFVAFVLNLLLYGSVGHHDMPPDAEAESLAWITPHELCAHIRKRHQVEDPKTKLLLAIDELTNIFDKFDEDGRTYIASRLGHLCDGNTQLLVTGFTVEAEKSFLGVSKRKPVLVPLVAVGEENRFRYIPLMTAMLWGIRVHIKSAHSAPTLKYFYCVAHEMTKSSPGLMGTIVERLVFNTDSHLKIHPDMSMWEVVEQLRDLLPDKNHFKDRTRCKSGLQLLDEYLTTPDPTIRGSAFEGLMVLNMAAPGPRLDAFRVIMALSECRPTPASTPLQPPPLQPAVRILSDFMDHYNTLYEDWNNVSQIKDDTNNDSWGKSKGVFLEVACRFGLQLLWLQMQQGIVTENTALLPWKSQLCVDDLEVKPFIINFPVNKKFNPVDLNDNTKAMFTPNTLFYPNGKPKTPESRSDSKPEKPESKPDSKPEKPESKPDSKPEKPESKPESNPLVDLVLNMPTTDGGHLQVWVQSKHTTNKLALTTKKLNNAMSVVDQYNKTHQKGTPTSPPVRQVLYLVVGPGRLSVTIKDDKGAVVDVTSDAPYTLPHRPPSSAPLTIHCITSPQAREALLGGFISQVVPDFDSHDSALELSLPQKITQLSALNRTPLADETPEQTQNRLDVTAHEDKLIEYINTIPDDDRFKACLDRVKPLK